MIKRKIFINLSHFNFLLESIIGSLQLKGKKGLSGQTKKFGNKNSSLVAPCTLKKHQRTTFSFSFNCSFPISVHSHIPIMEGKSWSLKPLQPTFILFLSPETSKSQTWSQAQWKALPLRKLRHLPTALISYSQIPCPHTSLESNCISGCWQPHHTAQFSAWFCTEQRAWALMH